MKGIRFLVFLVAVGLLVWGGQRYLAGQEQPIEDHYYCAFYELADHLAGLEAELDKVLVAMDPANRTEYLFNAYHHAVAARLHLEHLPTLPLNLTKTTLFLRTCADYARQGILEPAQDADFSELPNFLKYLREMNRKLQETQLAVQSMDPHTSWARGFTVALETPAEAHPAATSLLAIEELLRELSSPVEARSPGEAAIDPATARRVAMAFCAGRLQDHLITVTPSSKDTEQTYTVEMVPALGTAGERMTVAVTKSSGQILWMLSDFVPTRANLSPEEALERGQQFLREQGLAPMVNVTVDHVSANYLIASFAPVIEGVVDYGRQVKLRIELERGLVIGYDASAYLSSVPGQLATAALIGLTAARERLHPAFVPEGYKQVFFPVDGVPRVAYEFWGKLGEQRYLIYIDGETGRELAVKRD